MEEGAYDDEPPPPPPTQSQASSHFPLEPISGATLFDVEVARREQLRRRGALATGCGEIDRQVLGGRGGGGGFERGSVVGISAESMDTGLLIGLQTIAHSLVASLVGTEPGTARTTTAEQQQHPQPRSTLLRAAVITTLPAPTILPHLRDVIKVQARLKLGGQSPPEAVDAVTRQCLQQISVSRVFDIEGLWEVLSELEFAAAAIEEDQIPAAGSTMASKEDEDEGKLEAGKADPAPPSDMVLPESSQRPPSPSPSLPPPPAPAPAPATKLPPLRIRTEVQDSDEEEDVLLSSSPLSSLRSTPTLSPEAMDELAALSQPTIPNRPPSSPPGFAETVEEPKAPSPSPSPLDAQSRQQSPSPVPPTEQEEPAAASGLPDIILITHISSLFSTLFTGRDKTSAHTTLQLLSSHLRYLSRSAGPLILLLNITSSSSSSSSSTTNNPAQPPRRPESEQQPPPRPLDPTLRSIFNPPPPSHLGYAATTTTAHHAHALSRKNKPAFGQTFAQFLDLHLLCTQVPRSREDAEVLFSSTTRQQQQQQQQRPVRYAWVVETLVDELGAWEWEDDAATEGKDSSKGEKTLGEKRWKMVDREQKWGAVEVRNAGCQVVDAFDSTRNTGKMNVEPIRLAAGFGGRRV